MIRHCKLHVSNGGFAPATPGLNAVAPEWLFGGGAANFAAPAIPAAESTLGVAVGMPVARHLPHRSVGAALPHTALPLDSGVEANVRIGMKSAGTRNPPVKDRSKLFPIGLSPLTTAA